MNPRRDVRRTNQLHQLLVIRSPQLPAAETFPHVATYVDALAAHVASFVSEFQSIMLHVGRRHLKSYCAMLNIGNSDAERREGAGHYPKGFSAARHSRSSR